MNLRSRLSPALRNAPKPKLEIRRIGPSVALSPSNPVHTNDRAKKYAVGIVAAVKRKLAARKSDPADVSLLSHDEILSDVTEWIPTGMPFMDDVFGGGWPVGRMVELFGDEGAGKSALSHLAILQSQREGGVPILLDFEMALDKKKMNTLGIDPSCLVYASPRTMEDGLDLIESVLTDMEKSPPPSPVLIVWDSIALAVPSAELEESSNKDPHVGLQARIMGKGMRKLVRRVAKLRVCVIFINQQRDTIGKAGPRGGFQEPTTPGGKATKFTCSLRLRCQRVKTIKSGDRPVAYLIKTSTKKCRLAPPHQSVVWWLDFTVGPSIELSILQRLKDAKVAKPTGGGSYGVPWCRSFKSEKWIELMQDKEFADKARAASRTSVPQFGTFAAMVDGSTDGAD